METKTATWQERFGLTTCPAESIDPTIPPYALGVAVVYATEATGEKIFLVVESRSGSLRSQCARRLQTAKLPPGTPLTVAFQGQVLPDDSPEAVDVACRQQVVLAGELRRELRPAMR